MSERFQVVPSVFIAATSGNKVLLQLRQNTGFYDGYYDLPSGHVEENENLHEAGARELQEETGIASKKTDLSLFHICQDFETPGKPYIYFFFKTTKYSGQPVIGDPEKITEVGFFGLDELPQNTTPHVVTALGDLASKEVGFSVIN